MKKFISTMLYVIMSFCICTAFSADAMTRIYYPDGSDKLVGQSAVETETLHGGRFVPYTQEAAVVFSEKAEPSPTPTKTPELNQEDPTVVMYAPDGRTISIPAGEVEAYKNVGWFTEPVITVYAADGRTLDIPVREKEAYLNVGWFETPVTILYAPDGRTITVALAEVEAYKNVGWYTEPMTTVFAADGRTLDIPVREKEAYLNVGWYQSLADIPKTYPQGTKMVALTFDDGPSKHTSKILDCLAANNAKATFFVVGYNVNTYASVLERAASLGMEIGNHTMNHKNLKTLGADGVRAELKTASDAIVSITGARPTLIRPPYGNYNSTVSSVADAPLILWSVDTLDWKTRNADSTVSSILNNVKDGSIVLMHDLYSQSAEAAVRVIPELIARGYKLVTVSELAQAKGIALANGKAYSAFR